MKAYLYETLDVKEEQKPIIFIIESFGSIIIKSDKNYKKYQNY